jgi:hypothetical protein
MKVIAAIERTPEQRNLTTPKQDNQPNNNPDHDNQDQAEAQKSFAGKGKPRT